MCRVFGFQNRVSLVTYGCGLLLLIGGGCTPLKEVNAFSLASQATLDKAAAFDGYGRFDYCYDSVLVYTDTARYLRQYDCDCGHGTAADTLLRHADNILSAYFAALAKLADSKTVIKTSPLSSAVAAGTYGSVTVSSTEAGIFSGLVTAAQDLLTNHYKSKKIKEVLDTYHDTVRLALGMLMRITRHSKDLIEIMSNQFRGKVDSLVSKAESPGVRLTLVSLYREKTLRWQLAAADDDRQYQALAKIQEGHEALFEGAGHLKDESLKKKILGFAQNIIYLSQ